MRWGDLRELEKFCQSLVQFGFSLKPVSSALSIQSSMCPVSTKQCSKDPLLVSKTFVSLVLPLKAWAILSPYESKGVYEKQHYVTQSRIVLLFSPMVLLIRQPKPVQKSTMACLNVYVSLCFMVFAWFFTSHWFSLGRLGQTLWKAPIDAAHGGWHAQPVCTDALPCHQGISPRTTSAPKFNCWTVEIIGDPQKQSGHFLTNYQ